MPRVKKPKVGAPKGAVNNPTGKNQYANIRADKPISVRLLKESDQALRERAAIEGRTISQLVDEAIDLYLSARNP
jgi:hypothetical protein